ncbi:hypothetical protein GUJ93_ZPchr0002g26175 [Zizania palustris]|uniref:Uncharacterized protein n=1 Tax=Zizania palustris TaxID=103762 RepID=A0A8J5S747_ZIZPA|nr:hypothetical protein GUJ93_ZPchr0002g26175 [Zizania palustris]
MREQLEHEDDMGRARSTTPVVVRVHLGAVSKKRLRWALMQQRRGTRKKERKRSVGGYVGESELLPPPPPSPLCIASAREGGEERSGRKR